MGKYLSRAAGLAAVVVFGVATVGGHISDYNLVALGLGLAYGGKYLKSL